MPHTSCLISTDAQAERFMVNFVYGLYNNHHLLIFKTIFQIFIRNKPTAGT